MRSVFAVLITCRRYHGGGHLARTRMYVKVDGSMGRQVKKKAKHKSKKYQTKAVKPPRVLRDEEENIAGGDVIEPDRIHEKKKPKYTIDQLLDKADESIDTFDYEVAQRFCQRALEIDPDNVRVLETSGNLLLELGDTEAARKCFGRAVKKSPEAGHSKYMYLGQLLEGADAVECFQKGIELMLEAFARQQQTQAIEACREHNDSLTVRDISAAYCSVAEIFMTDLCGEPNAEDQCKTHIQKAIDLDPDNPETLQLMASFLLSVDNKQEAQLMIEKSVSLWLPQMEEAGKDGIARAPVDPVHVVSLSYPSRVAATKILIEVENYETASTILEKLLDEDESVTQVWYLIGWLNYLQGDIYRGNARFYLNKALEVNGKAPSEDVPMLQHIGELLEELGPNEDEEDDLKTDGEEDIAIDSDSD